MALRLVAIFRGMMKATTDFRSYQKFIRYCKKFTLHITYHNKIFLHMIVYKND